MKKLKKYLSVLLMFTIVLAGISIDGGKVHAAAGAKKHIVKLMGTGAVKILSGKKNVAKKTISIKQSEQVQFRHTKNKNIKSIKYSSGNKKVMIVTKAGKVEVKAPGTAKIKVTIKRKKKKAVSSWIKFEVAGTANADTKPSVTTVPSNMPSVAPDMGTSTPSATPDAGTSATVTTEPSVTAEPMVLPSPDDNEPENTPATVPSDNPTEAPTPENAKKELVIFFSRAGENYNVGTVEKGSTEIVAEMIAKQTEADLFKLETVKGYPADYMECVNVASEEKAADVRPELKGLPENLSEYQKIYLGYPIWHADMPMAVYTFLESSDFSGKEIYPFCTHAGSGLAGTVSKIQNKCTDAEVKDGLAILGTTVQNDRETTKGSVLEWLNKSGNIRSSEPPAATESPAESAQPTGYPVFNLADRTVILNNGIKMPILGIGTYQLSSAQAENSVYWALRAGYRLIDTARIYGNEEAEGR